MQRFFARTPGLPPFLNVFHARFLPDREALNFFLERGMPLDERIRANLRSYDRERLIRVFYNDSRVVPLNRWVRQHARSAYVAYLLANTIRSICEPIQHYRQLISPDSSEYRMPASPTPTWPTVLSNVTFPRDSTALLVATGLLVTVMAILIRLGCYEAWWSVPILPYLTVYPLMFVVWHGDAIEVERHAYPVRLQIQLARWMALMFCADAVVLCLAGKRRLEKEFEHAE